MTRMTGRVGKDELSLHGKLEASEGMEWDLLRRG